MLSSFEPSPVIQFHTAQQACGNQISTSKLGAERGRTKSRMGLHGAHTVPHGSYGLPHCPYGPIPFHMDFSVTGVETRAANSIDFSPSSSSSSKDICKSEFKFEF